MVREDGERETGFGRQHQAGHLAVRAVMLGENDAVELVDEPGQSHVAVTGLDLRLPA